MGRKDLRTPLQQCLNLIGQTYMTLIIRGEQTSKAVFMWETKAAALSGLEAVPNGVPAIGAPALRHPLSCILRASLLMAGTRARQGRRVTLDPLPRPSRPPPLAVPSPPPPPLGAIKGQSEKRAETSAGKSHHALMLDKEGSPLTSWATPPSLAPPLPSRYQPACIPGPVWGPHPLC